MGKYRFTPSFSRSRCRCTLWQPRTPPQPSGAFFPAVFLWSFGRKGSIRDRGPWAACVGEVAEMFYVGTPRGKQYGRRNHSCCQAEAGKDLLRHFLLLTPASFPLVDVDQIGNIATALPFPSLCAETEKAPAL